MADETPVQASSEAASPAGRRRRGRTHEKCAACGQPSNGKSRCPACMRKLTIKQSRRSNRVLETEVDRILRHLGMAPIVSSDGVETLMDGAGI